MNVVLLLLFALAASQRPNQPPDSCPPAFSRDVKAALRTVYGGSFNFGVEFFKTITLNSNERENVFMSPYSIYNALLLAYFGASGSTRAQLENVLQLGKLQKPEVAAALERDQVEKNNPEEKKNYILEVANRAYLDNRLDLHPCTVGLLKDTVIPANFQEVERLRTDINDFVDNKTRGRIPELLSRGILDSSSAFALINAAYFKGKWANQFKVQHTKKELFYPSTKQQQFFMVDMMYQKGQFRYGASEELQAYLLEMPYVGQSVSMYILLPPYVENGLEEILRRLTPDSLMNAIGQMFPTTLQVFIPKFKMEKSYELQKHLYDMGLTDMFDPLKANFSDFANFPGLSVGAAIHKSFIKVDEEGSEAAAATALIATYSAVIRKEKIFSANHPFIYIIYDNLANTILFIGILKRPPAAQ